MKRVICIDADETPDGHESDMGDWWLEEGEVYTVLRETTGYLTNGTPIPCYVLIEQPCKNGECFEQSRFIPCSDSDEKKLANTKELIEWVK